MWSRTCSCWAVRSVSKVFFTPLGLIPSGPRHARVGQDGVSWNHTTFLNIAFLVLAASLVYRFFRAGGRQMVTMMGRNADE